MSIEINKRIELEIAHVLFIDIVGYSKLSINEHCRDMYELRISEIGLWKEPQEAFHQTNIALSESR